MLIFHSYVQIPERIQGFPPLFFLAADRHWLNQQLSTRVMDWEPASVTMLFDSTWSHASGESRIIQMTGLFSKYFRPFLKVPSICIKKICWMAASSCLNYFRSYDKVAIPFPKVVCLWGGIIIWTKLNSIFHLPVCVCDSAAPKWVNLVLLKYIYIYINAWYTIYAWYRMIHYGYGSRLTTPKIRWAQGPWSVLTQCSKTCTSALRRDFSPHFQYPLVI